MEDGGTSLFEFAKQAHEYIRQCQIDIAHWKQVVRIILEQMVEAIAYIHSLNIVHFDISLENWLINEVKVDVVEVNGQTQKVSFVLDDIQVKLCDFGLAQKFTKHECISRKYCGKKGYKSPEILNNKKAFDAKANDIWCLGICFFMLVTGGGPWEIAHPMDANFVWVQTYSLFEMIKAWDILHYTDMKTINLFNGMLCVENKRANILQIMQYIRQQKQQQSKPLVLTLGRK